jgi:hypothetical protein
MIETFLGLVLLAVGFVAAGGIDKIKTFRQQKHHKAQMQALMALPHGNLKKETYDREAGGKIFVSSRLYQETVLSAAETYLKALRRGLPEQQFDSQAALFLFVAEQLERSKISDYRIDSDD